MTSPWQRTGARTLGGVVGALLTVAVLNGCTAGAVEPDDSAHAYLDSVSGEIVMPLNEYAFYGRHADEQVFDTAAEAVVGECMREKGFTYSVARTPADPTTDLDDRTFGMWHELRAERYGFGSADSPLDVALEQARAVGGMQWSAARDACYEDDESVRTAMDTVNPRQDEYLNSLASRLESEALTRAQKDERWQRAREPWEQCLKEAGLTPESGEHYRSKQSNALPESYGGSGSEEGIRLASIEARCNTESRLTQTLADLEAAYQQPLIEANQAALNEEKERKQELLGAARAYIAAHG
ncbi:hypothetical protein EDF36_2720 [Rathayibacter sp. PhB152]|uniref:hypothetical protein n=1 Tax=Rathayibacter sp. PhB152 TaxID=2485190 RepID=UPI000F4B2640|nr:hypothetical protein [Rathayibacter sp. PhB152]ROQ57195.1 hypothetical protein EDF36_2720 [Rathayibacter sp. PhB152]